MLHENFYPRQFLRRDRFVGKAEIVVRAVGHARAHALAREVAVVVNVDHARWHDIDVRRISPGFSGSLGDTRLGPFKHVEIEAGAEDHAVADASGNPESARPFGGDVDRHGPFADLQHHGARSAFFARGNDHAAIVQEVADGFQPALKIGKPRGGSSQAVDRPVARTHADNRPPV